MTSTDEIRCAYRRSLCLRQTLVTATLKEIISLPKGGRELQHEKVWRRNETQAEEEEFVQIDSEGDT